ncbi:MAG: hypothetical protein M1817_001899 [Caeruleum heppii]|nr:MAG: hypothetical protein M1817_001899 [Caeruleum heppii]
MSEQIPESIPTSADPRSRRPLKKRALGAAAVQASQVENLFAKADREVIIPASATKDVTARTMAPPPEIVANVQGSSAGAGSGEFHVYKASRRREYERLRLMDEQVKRGKEKDEFEQKLDDWKKKDDAKTSKNQKRREKMKARKSKAKATPDGPVASQGSAANSESDVALGSHAAVIDGGPVQADGSATQADVAIYPPGLIIHED